MNLRNLDLNLLVIFSAIMKQSERRACRMLGLHRSTQRRIPVGRDDEAELTADIIELARKYGRYGYRKIVYVGGSGMRTDQAMPRSLAGLDLQMASIF